MGGTKASHAVRPRSLSLAEDVDTQQKADALNEKRIAYVMQTTSYVEATPIEFCAYILGPSMLRPSLVKNTDSTWTCVRPCVDTYEFHTKLLQHIWIEVDVCTSKQGLTWNRNI